MFGIHTARRVNWVTAGAGLALAAGLAFGIAGPAHASGLTGPAFYVDGIAYRTAGTATDFSGTGAPLRSYDIIYNLGGAQPLNIATAAPGDPGFSGGRWMVHAVSFPSGYRAALAVGDSNGNGVLDSDEELMAAIAAGAAVDNGVVKSFECPVVRI